MSDSPTPLTSTPATSGPSLEALAEAQQSLRTALNVTLVMLIVLTGSLFVFFLREISIARRQINDLTRVVVEYEKNSVPLMEDFRSKLQVFARAHPDFAPIYVRYFGTNAVPLTQSTGRAQPVSTSAAPRLPPKP